MYYLAIYRDLNRLELFILLVFFSLFIFFVLVVVVVFCSFTASSYEPGRREKFYLLFIWEI